MIKLARLIDEKLHTTLTRLSKESLPIKTAFKLKGISKIVESEYLKYEEVRREAINKYGSRDEEGVLIVDKRGNATLSPDKIKDFSLELKELVEMDVDMPTISLSELGNISISAVDLIILDGIIVDDSI